MKSMTFAKKSVSEPASDAGQWTILTYRASTGFHTYVARTEEDAMNKKADLEARLVVIVIEVKDPAGNTVWKNDLYKSKGDSREQQY